MIFTKWDIVEPDLLCIASDQMGILTDKNVQGPPALVVEILSRGTRTVDEGAKLRLFERGGVREYWLLDPEGDRVTIWRRRPAGSFALASGLSREQQDVLATPLVPELRIPLARLFA